MILQLPRVFSFVFVLVWAVSNQTVHAQELNVVQISSNKRTVLDALKTLDSPNTKEQEWVMPFLEKTLQEDPSNSLASTALALQQIRTQDFKAASQTLLHANETLWGGVTRSTNGKAKLLCAINLEDVALANKLFAALVEATQRDGISLAVRKSYCQWLGEIIGTLESPEAKSPIPNEVLLKARKTLLASSEIALSEAFRNQFELARQKSGRVEAFMAKHRELGDDGLEKIRLELDLQLRQMEIDLNGELQERRDIAAENSSATRSVRLDLAANRERLRQLEQEWATPTAGQPFNCQRHGAAQRQQQQRRRRRTAGSRQRPMEITRVLLLLSRLLVAPSSLLLAPSSRMDTTTALQQSSSSMSRMSSSLLFRKSSNGSSRAQQTGCMQRRQRWPPRAAARGAWWLPGS